MAGAVGRFVLLEGIKGGKEELTVLPPLFIRAEEGGYTVEMEAIFRDLAAVHAAGGG